MNWDKAFGGIFAGFLLLIGIMVAVAPLRSSPVSRQLEKVTSELALARSDLNSIKAELASVRREVQGSRSLSSYAVPSDPIVAEAPPAAPVSLMRTPARSR